MNYLPAFLIGGGWALAAQLLMDLTPHQLTPAHVMVIFVSLGAALSGLGLYEPLIGLGGAGAIVPLPGFGHVLVQGMQEGMKKEGVALGILKGGLGGAALGLSVAIVVGYVMAVAFRPKG